MELKDIYFDASIRKYAYSLTKDKYLADELVSEAFEICSSKNIQGHLKGYFATVMRNRWYSRKQNNNADIEDIPNEEAKETIDVKKVLENIYPYYSNILTATMNGSTLTAIHKETSISYKTLKNDYQKAKKEFKLMSSDTKVAIIVQSNSGVSYHRLQIPFAKIFKDYGLDCKIYWNSDDSCFDKLEGVTHVVYNRNISAKMQPEIIIARLKKLGIKVICDIDDYWELPVKHDLNRFYKQTNLGNCIITNMILADQVWTTTKRLASAISKYNKNVHVIKNAICKDVAQFAPTQVSIAYDTFFYSGGRSHFYDLLLLSNYFNDEQLFIKTPLIPKKIKGQQIASSDIDTYALDYHDCGICVIPLVENKFNSFKSELKMIEAGHFCKPVIVSNVAPYDTIATNLNSIKVHGNDWSKAIKRIKGNYNLQNDLALKLKEDVETKYNLDKENRNRIQLL